MPTSARLTAPLVTLSLRSKCAHWLWQSALLDLCAEVLRIPTTSLRTGLGMTRKFFRLLSLRGRKAPVAIRIPVPSAPLPKGGWHGEAVTGGFHAGTFLSNLRRGRCLHRPEPDFSRTHGRARGPCPTKTVVGRDPCVPPHTAPLAMCRWLRQSAPPTEFPLHRCRGGRLCPSLRTDLPIMGVGRAVLSPPYEVIQIPA